ncbi:aminotransferase class V-fold PLP-dependent enzyme, partial [Staphylococcus aureus]|nr:aminotransferase class V-fold PLP-dependent enzyme [Staphylococcus aureus]
THNESSTGVVSDIVGACRLIRAHGALPIVDGVSLFGGDHSRIAEALPAVYATTTQKCLALGAGQAILFVHRDALDKAAQV